MASETLRSRREELARFIRERWGPGGEVRLAFGPGRVNLIGEHTDYNGGYVFPIAIDRAVYVAFRPSRDELCRFWSVRFGELDEFRLDRLDRVDGGSWRNYVRGVASVLRERGLRPVEAAVWGDVPLGAGLSSSAAIEVATALAFCTASGIELSRRDLALKCQQAENRFVGVNCGIMDQFVSIHGRASHAVLIDCKTLEHRLVPLDASRARIVVCNTMVHHELGSSAYNERRAACESAVAVLGRHLRGITALRDVSSEQLERYRGELDDVTYRRARHVVTEDERVLAAIGALEAGDLAAFGRLMNGSHDSLRDDYEVSCRELDVMVDLARKQAGCLGSRLTGAGFGGCAVCLVESGAVDGFVTAMGRGYEKATGLKPEIYVCSPADGAGVA